MTRNCDDCGSAYEARRPNHRFCSTACRVRHHQKGLSGPPVVAAKRPAAPSGLVAAVKRELDAADRSHTALGETAVALAESLVSSYSTGAAKAVLSKELRSVLAEALEGASVAADPVDELRRRRDLKRVAG